MSAVYNLYFTDPFTGKLVAKFNYNSLKELKRAWLAFENRDYILHATQEKKITNLPTRKTQTYQNVY